MTRIIMLGCNGKMGQNITNLVKEDPDCEIVAGIDKFDDGHNAYPVFGKIGDCNVEADVVIDFSSPSEFDDRMDYCIDKNIGIVLCTTGLSADQLKRIESDSKKIAVLRSANMSLGINLLLKMVKDATAVLAKQGFDIEIVEKHHRLKKDAPSGTAIALAESINDELNKEYEFVYNRSDRSIKRPDKEIGISAVRGGTIVGDHDVIFAGNDEVITFSHTAYSKSIFGKGAISAAKFLKGKKPGLYDMSQVIADILK